MPHIDYFFSTFSPFTFFAGTRFEEVAARHGASVTYKPLDLMALFARTGGTAPKDRHPSRIEYRGQELRRQARKLGITINPMPPGYPPNPAPSSYALIAAQKAGGGDLGALVQAYGRACWIEERNIGIRAGGGVANDGEGGDRVWKDALMPDEKKALKQFFK